MRTLLAALLLLPLPAAAGESTPEAAIAALWRAQGNAPGGSADTATLARVLHKDAVVFGARTEDGAPVLRRTSREAFLAMYEGDQDKGFHECEVSRTLHVYERFATAYSVVESRTHAHANAPDFVGVNSVQLYREGDQWTVVSLYYHVEAPGVPIPIGDGVSGTCL